jgi:transcriptional regulator with XRE-family HTH domain
MSQLDLALAAGVSARHVSFLETGRSQPSRDMLLRLGVTLAVPLRDQNAWLRAAGLGSAFADPGFEAPSPGVERALALMLARHEPYPMLVLDRAYVVVRRNEGARRLLERLSPTRPAQVEPPNLLRFMFDPLLGRSALLDWEATARALLLRVRREVLARPTDTALSELIAELLAYPNVPKDFQRANLAAPSEPTLVIRLKVGAQVLSFISTVTAFNSPQNVALDELRIESYYPLDDATAEACASFDDV